MIARIGSLFLRLFGKTRYDDLESLLFAYGNKGKAPQVLYLGDSTVERVSDNDADKSMIPDMVKRAVKGEFEIIQVSQSAYHMSVYRGLIGLFNRTLFKPKIIIIPINMRSFSPQWDLYPPYQFEEELRLLSKCSKRKHGYLDQKRNDNRASIAVFEDTQVDYPLVNFKTIREFRNIILSKPVEKKEIAFRRRCIFIFHYLYSLQPSHRKLRDMKHLIAEARAMQIKLCFYITPVNYISAIQYVGSEFDRVFGDNLRCVIAVLEAEGVYSLNEARLSKESSMLYRDLSCSINGSYFFHPDTLTEHLNERGRQFVAEEITQMLLKPKELL